MSLFRKTCLSSLLIILLAAAPAQATEVFPDDLPLTSCAAAVVIEATSGEIVFGYNEDIPLPPASCGKIATALLALRLADDIEATSIISAAAAAVPESSIYLREGEQLTLEDLLRGALVHSGNDACFALAEAVAGSEPLFVHLLGWQAGLSGAWSGQFRNTNGLPNEEHQISALDLARLTAAAMEEELFADIVASCQVSLGEGASRRSYKNTNKLLWQDAHIVGVKTGTTDAAGPCLVTAWQEGAALYISVVYNSRDRYGESLRLLHYAAENYLLVRPVEQGQALAFWPEWGCLLYAGSDLSALVQRGREQQLTLSWELPYALSLLDEYGCELDRVQLSPVPPEGNPAVGDE